MFCNQLDQIKTVFRHDGCMVVVILSESINSISRKKTLFFLPYPVKYLEQLGKLLLIARGNSPSVPNLTDGIPPNRNSIGTRCIQLV